MKFLTLADARKWCEDRTLKFTADRYLYYDQQNPYCFSVGLEDKPASRLIALADYLVPTWKSDSFKGALLLIRERGIWGDFSETVGAKIIGQMRLAKGETESVEKYPGHLFGPEELFEMHSFFVVPLLFGWDTFLVPDEVDYFIFLSHDGIAEVISRTLKTHEELQQQVLDWNPQEDKGWYCELARH